MELHSCSNRLDEMGALRQILLEHRKRSIWRLFASPCLHAGAVHLFINLASVIFVGFHLEQEFGPCKCIFLFYYFKSTSKSTIVRHGSLLYLTRLLSSCFRTVRTGIIYILSAFFGSLVAALFIQNSPAVGSSGALFGLLGAMLSELVRNWGIYSNKVFQSPYIHGIR